MSELINKDFFSAKDRCIYFMFGCFPYLIFAVLHFYFAYPMDLIRIPGVDPKNPFADPEKLAIVLNHNTYSALFCYFLSFFFGVVFLILTARLYFNKASELFALVLFSILWAFFMFFMYIYMNAPIVN